MISADLSTRPAIAVKKELYDLTCLEQGTRVNADCQGFLELCELLFRTAQMFRRGGVYPHPDHVIVQLSELLFAEINSGNYVDDIGFTYCLEVIPGSNNPLQDFG